MCFEQKKDDYCPYSSKVLFENCSHFFYCQDVGKPSEWLKPREDSSHPKSILKSPINRYQEEAKLRHLFGIF